MVQLKGIMELFLLNTKYFTIKIILILLVLFLFGCNSSQEKINELNLQIQKLEEELESSKEQPLLDTGGIMVFEDSSMSEMPIKVADYMRVNYMEKPTLADLVFHVNSLARFYKNIQCKAVFRNSFYSVDIYIKGTILEEDTCTLEIRRDYKFRDGQSEMVEFKQFTSINYLGQGSGLSFLLSFYDNEQNFKVQEVKTNKKHYIFKDPPFDEPPTPASDKAVKNAKDKYSELCKALQKQNNSLYEIIFAQNSGIPAVED